MQAFDGLRIVDPNATKLDAIKSIAVSGGCNARLAVCFYMQTLCIVDWSDRHLLWLAPWDGHWVVCLNGPRFYCIRNEDDLKGFLTHYLQLINDDLEVSVVPGQLTDRYGIVEIAHSEWHNAVFQRLSEEYSKAGWHELPDDESVEAWRGASEAAERLLGGSKVPQSSMSWNIEDIANGGNFTERQQALVCDLELKVLRAMKLVGDGVWMVLDFNHPCYRVHSHRVPETFHPWPISLVPNDDEAVFIASDYSCGIQTMLRKSITVFGQPLLDVLRSDLPDLLAR
ncbi:DUF2716 domain-containing protein [Aeoliella mucimassa]|uniref:Uncharacterized protein n=1 Tax=Aeoliella mucimassa TaxID=2527972 RepID=A0A518AUN6_9BACT|nr:DUF2716 domain-containing protein [Aeoliella mucimassa]QDU58434.1 hypothetical protein Pan181_46700 [Aeoliella mucimassa]